jgi:CspA family cold shock protein
MKGKVLKYDPDKGTGFILGDDGNTYFVHFSNIEKRPLRILYPDEYVDFEAKPTNEPRKHDRAINIVPRNLDGSSNRLLKKSLI